MSTASWMSTETGWWTWQWGRWGPPPSSGQTRRPPTGPVAGTLIGRSHAPRSRGVVRVQAGLLFQPEKVDVSNKDCRRGGKAAACMAVTVCLSLSSRTSATATVGAGELASGGGSGG